MHDPSTEEQYNRQDRRRAIICDNKTMAKLFRSAAPLDTGPVVVVVLLSAAFVAGAGVGVAVENYSAASTAAVATGSGHFAPPRDNGAANKLGDYLKGYPGAGINDFGPQQQDSIEYQADYGSTQARYGSSDGGSVEQQSHISAGYHQPQQATYQQSGSSGSAYDVPHQSDIDKFVENNFSHQYDQESPGVGDITAGYHSAAGDEGAPADYHQSQAGFTASHHTDVINYVPYPVVKKLHVPFSKAVQIPISHAVIIPVRKPVPIHIPVTKQVQVPVEKELKIPVERLVPYPVEKQVPVPVEKHVPYPVVRYLPVKVHKPYPVKVPVVKTVVHKVKQFW